MAYAKTCPRLRLREVVEFSQCTISNPNSTISSSHDEVRRSLHDEVGNPYRALINLGTAEITVEEQAYIEKGRDEFLARLDGLPYKSKTKMDHAKLAKMQASVRIG